MILDIVQDLKLKIYFHFLISSWKHFAIQKINMRVALRPWSPHMVWCAGKPHKQSFVLAKWNHNGNWTSVQAMSIKHSQTEFFNWNIELNWTKSNDWFSIAELNPTSIEIYRKIFIGFDSVRSSTNRNIKHNQTPIKHTAQHQPKAFERIELNRNLPGFPVRLMFYWVR